MTNTYELPRTNDGRVDVDAVCADINSEFSVYEFSDSMDFDAVAKILKAVDANARAETKEACATLCEELAMGWDGSSRVSAFHLAVQIRNMEGPK